MHWRSSAFALEILQHCTKPSTWFAKYFRKFAWNLVGECLWSGPLAMGDRMRIWRAAVHWSCWSGLMSSVGKHYREWDCSKDPQLGIFMLVAITVATVLVPFLFLSHCNSFQDHASEYEISGCPIPKYRLWLHCLHGPWCQKRLLN